jgi:GNAT superfamily N-acetyltransferase
MIRDATADDVPALVELGRVMHAESARFSRLAFSEARLDATLRIAIERHFARVIEVDGEVIGGMVALLTPHWFSDDLTACDLALFTHPRARGTSAAARLLKEYAAWAKASGSMLTLFGVMSGVNVDQTVALCERIGWRRAGVVMES